MFGDSIDYDIVRIDEWSLGNLINGQRPFVTFNTIKTWGSLDNATFMITMETILSMVEIGHDLIISGDNADRLDGGDGNDSIYGLDGDDTIDGGSGNDLIYGYAGNDTINDREGHDTIEGGDGSDTIHGWSGNDNIRAYNGDDVVYGGNGDDSIDGGDDKDLLYGWDGNDTLPGGIGNDTLDGKNGDDVIVGSQRGVDEIDYLTGRDGADRFLLGDYHGHMYSVGGDSDYAVITDFQKGQDTIQLDRDLNYS